MKRNSRVAGPLIAVAVTFSTATGFAGATHAQTITPPSIWAPLREAETPKENQRIRKGPRERRYFHHKAPGVLGTITTKNGNTLIVAGINGTTYTVDASGAKIVKSSAGAHPAEVSIAELAVGDTVGMKGTLLGANLTAREIFAGVPPRPLLPFMKKLIP